MDVAREAGLSELEIAALVRDGTLSLPNRKAAAEPVA
jgi:hypothetical protein